MCINTHMVPIESDGDLHVTLTSFVEVAEGGAATRLCTLHVRECTEVILKRNDRLEPLQPRLQPKKRPGDPTSTCKSSKAAI